MNINRVEYITEKIPNYLVQLEWSIGLAAGTFCVKMSQMLMQNYGIFLKMKNRTPATSPLPPDRPHHTNIATTQ